MSVKILIVDDSRVERNYLTGLLRALGMEADSAESCDEGVKLAAENQYDIMFIDYFMPDSDGVHTLKEIRSGENSRNKDTPAVALGTADNSEGNDFFLHQGFQNYIEKPVGHELLHAALLIYLPEEKRAEIGADKAAPPENRLLPEKYDWLYDIEEINVENGVKFCGSEEAFIQALEIFFNSIQPYSDEIEKYYTKGRWKNYTIKVHALKSSARIIGLAELSELAKQLEAAGDANDLEFIHAKTGELLEWYRSFREKFSPLLPPAEDDNDKPMAEQDFLEDAFSSLEEFAGQMDFDMTEEVINSVREYRLEPADKEIFEEVCRAFDAVDWTALSKAAHKYIERIYGSSNG